MLIEKRGRKEIEKVIDKALKNLDKLDENNLRSILAEMSYDEISYFWREYSFDRNYSEVNQKIAYWKTRDQEKYIFRDYGNYKFYPKNQTEKDKDEIIEHVVLKIKKNVEEEVERKIQFKNQPFLKKASYYVSITRFIILPFLIIFSIFGKYEFCFYMGITSLIILILAYVFYFLIEIIISIKYKV
jgi:hypothetical protein